MNTFFFPRKNADQQMMIEAVPDSPTTKDDMILENLKDRHKKDTARVARAMLFLLPDANLGQKTSREVADAMYCLVVASERFSTPELSKKAVILAIDAIRKNASHSLACLALAEQYQEVFLEAETFARDVIRTNPKILLNAESLTLLNASCIQKVINDVDTDEFTRFQILEAWSKTDELRPNIAAELIKGIELESIDTVHLVTTVERSGLVTRDQLYEAYKAQAMHANSDNLTTSGAVVSDGLGNAKIDDEYIEDLEHKNFDKYSPEGSGGESGDEGATGKQNEEYVTTVDNDEEGEPIIPDEEGGGNWQVNDQ